MNIEDLTAEELTAELERRKDAARAGLIQERKTCLDRIHAIDKELGFQAVNRRPKASIGKASELDPKIIAAVQGGASSRAEIAKALGVEPLALRFALVRLSASGHLVSTGAKSGRRYAA